jgi:1,4-alpha-glucan branching enzyme
MKKSLLLLLFFTILNTIHAQVIEVDPAFPTDQDAIIITFNATEGSGGLAGYTGDVYAHTGVITSNSTGSSDWKYVVSDWGENDPKTKLTRIATDVYTLSLSPSIREYYGVPAAETIQQIALVFRSGVQVDGNYLEGKTAENGDIFYDVYEAGLNVAFIQPTLDQVLVEAGTSIPVSVASNDADSTILLINDIKVSSSTTNSLEYTIIASGTGTSLVKAVAYANNEIVVDSFSYYIRSAVTIEELPAGMVDGINYLNESTVLLCLFAPEKSFVFVMSEFNNWSIDETNYMKRTPDSKRYWLQINNLEPGKEYAYQYLVDGELKIGDPYCNKILDPWNDSYISNSTYPNLKPYPVGKTNGFVSIFQTAQQPYNWEIESFSPRPNDELLIYELHIRDFVATRDIKTVRDTLDYLQNLGITAIELMPINEFEGNDSWGYNPAYYFATDKAYGTMNDYKAFIDECHKRGIAVIIDMVLNHSYGQSPLVQLYFDASNDSPAANNPWYNQVCPHQPYCWGYDFNHESQYTELFIDRVNKFWIDEFKVDGYRFDFTKGFSNVNGDGSAYNPARIENLKRMADKIWEVNDNAYIILEHFGSTNEEIELTTYGMMVWGNIVHNYNQATMGYVEESDFSWVSYEKRGFTKPNLVGYMESHDEERQMFKNITYGNSNNPNHNVKLIDIATRRNAAAAAMFLLVPGPKMIWQFGELGYDVSIDYGGRVSPKPIRWNYYSNLDRKRLYNYYAALMELRKSHDVFKTSEYTLNASGVTKSLHLVNDDMSVAVLANFDIWDQEIDPKFLSLGKWYDYFHNDSLDVVDANAPILLGAGEFRVYTTKRLVSPTIGINENASGNNSSIKVFPNPSDGNFELEMQINAVGEYNILIYNSIGNTISQFNQPFPVSGKQTLKLNSLVNYPDGLYYVVVKNGSKIQSARLLKQ